MFSRFLLVFVLLLSSTAYAENNVGESFVKDFISNSNSNISECESKVGKNVCKHTSNGYKHSLKLLVSLCKRNAMSHSACENLNNEAARQGVITTSNHAAATNERAARGMAVFLSLLNSGLTR